MEGVFTTEVGSALIVGIGMNCGYMFIPPCEPNGQLHCVNRGGR